MIFTKIAIDKMAVVDELLDAISNAGDHISGGASDLADAASGHLSGVGSKLDEVLGNLKEHAGAAADSASSHLSDAGSKLDEFLGAAKGHLSNAYESAKGGINNLIDSIKGHAGAASTHADAAKDSLSSLLHEHPEKALAAAGGAGAGATGLAGFLGFRKGKKSGAEATASVVADELKALGGKNKKLALIAALGIPASVGATYLATRDK